MSTLCAYKYVNIPYSSIGQVYNAFTCVIDCDIPYIPHQEQRQAAIFHPTTYPQCQISKCFWLLYTATQKLCRRHCQPNVQSVSLPQVSPQMGFSCTICSVGLLTIYTCSRKPCSMKFCYYRKILSLSLMYNVYSRCISM